MSETLPPIQGNSGDGGGGMFRPQNRRKINPSDLKKLPPQQRSRYMAYEDPPKHVQEAQTQTKKRLMELRKQEARSKPSKSAREEVEREKHFQLIGQLKAAEARNRLRIMRLRYQANKAQEIGHLIACQPVALKALRLQALLPPYQDVKSRSNVMTKLERQRVEALIEDTTGLLTNRVS